MIVMDFDLFNYILYESVTPWSKLGHKGDFELFSTLLYTVK